MVVDGTQYDSLDLSAASTSAAKATALSTLIAASGYVVRFVDGAYVAFYQWRPGGSAPAFTRRGEQRRGGGLRPARR